MNKIIKLACSFFLFLYFVTPVWADNLSPWGMAYNVVLNDTQVSNGHLVALEDGVYRLTSREYDPYAIGVINSDPTISVDLIGRSDSYPMVTNGQAYVLVNDSNGIVTVGDYITTSSKPGVGMKAVVDGVVIGQAMESATLSAGSESLVLVALNLHFRGTTAGPSMIEDTLLGQMRQTLVGLLGIVQKASGVSSNDAFKYLLAAFVVIIALLFSYFTFGRVAQSGVEAVGRNPLARKAILIGIILNVFISMGIMFSGLLIAYYVIRF